MRTDRCWTVTRLQTDTQNRRLPRLWFIAACYWSVQHLLQTRPPPRPWRWQQAQGSISPDLDTSGYVKVLRGPCARFQIGESGVHQWLIVRGGGINHEAGGTDPSTNVATDLPDNRTILPPSHQIAPSWGASLKMLPLISEDLGGCETPQFAVVFLSVRTDPLLTLIQTLASRTTLDAKFSPPTTDKQHCPDNVLG